jgi:hypothetical protein
LIIGIRTLFDRVTRGYSDHYPLTRPKEEVTHGGRGSEVVHVGGLKVEEVEEGRVVDGERGPRRGPRRGDARVSFFLIVGGLYSVTALRENDQERVTVYTKHRLKLHSQTTRK